MFLFPLRAHDFEAAVREKEFMLTCLPESLTNLEMGSDSAQ